LVVDSSDEHGAEVAGTLEGAGWRAIKTTDPWEAMSLLSQMTVDLIVVDLDLPGVGGSGFCSLLSDDAGLQAIPAIFLWSTQTEIGAPLRPSSRDGSLEKPLHRDTLLATARRLLASPFPPDEPETVRERTRFIRRRRSVPSLENSPAKS
jgi:DNA-binding response OmpR family regulator